MQRDINTPKTITLQMKRELYLVRPDRMTSKYNGFRHVIHTNCSHGETAPVLCKTNSNNIPSKKVAM